MRTMTETDVAPVRLVPGDPAPEFTLPDADGNDAYTTKNPRKWTAANENLAKLHDRLEKLAGADGGGPGGERDLPDTSVLKDHFRQEVDSLRLALNAKRDEVRSHAQYVTKLKGRCDEVERALDKMEAEIDKVEETDTKGLVDQFLPNKYDPPAFALRLAHKDVTLATQLGRELKVPMHMANLALDELTAALNRGWENRDSRVAMLLQQERAGVKIEVPEAELKAAIERDGKQ